VGDGTRACLLDELFWGQVFPLLKVMFFSGIRRSATTRPRRQSLRLRGAWESKVGQSCFFFSFLLQSGYGREDLHRRGGFGFGFLRLFQLLCETIVLFRVHSGSIFRGWA
jgi:hypothetical protein